MLVEVVPVHTPYVLGEHPKRCIMALGRAPIKRTLLFRRPVPLAVTSTVGGGGGSGVVDFTMLFCLFNVLYSEKYN